MLNEVMYYEFIPWILVESTHFINQIKKVRSKKMMDHLIPQTKYTISFWAMPDEATIMI
jgi:hypothetical protein